MNPFRKGCFDGHFQSEKLVCRLFARDDGKACSNDQRALPNERSFITKVCFKVIKIKSPELGGAEDVLSKRVAFAVV